MDDQPSAEPAGPTSGGIDGTTFRTDAGARDEGVVGHAPASAGMSDLERRVLAHERILQSLIAHMAETEPKFLLRLSEKFSEPMRMVRNEHDYKDADSYANEFIRAVVSLGERAASIPVTAAANRGVDTSLASAPRSPRGLPLGLAPDMQVRERVQVREHAGVWEVLVDGRFYGQYVKQEHALEAVKSLT